MRAPLALGCGRRQKAAVMGVLSETGNLPLGRASKRVQEEVALSSAHLHAVPSPNSLVELYSEAPLPTRHGLLRAFVFRETGTGKEHVVAVKGDVRGHEGVPVRVHSECLTSEILGSLKCDCREQLEHALGLIGRSARGAMIPPRHAALPPAAGDTIRARAGPAPGAG